MHILARKKMLLLVTLSAARCAPADFLNSSQIRAFFTILPVEACCDYERHPPNTISLQLPMYAAFAAFSSFFSGSLRPEVPSRYRPLQAADSIRLVCLSTIEGRVHGTLKEVRLSDNPEYRALSYVWSAAYDGVNGETPDATRAFVLDGQEIQVTSNLADFFDAIVQLKLPIRVFWIDAICINQTDNDEKSVQLRMMRRI